MKHPRYLDFKEMPSVSVQITDADIQLAINIEEILGYAPPLPTESSIYKVPVNLRGVNEVSYTPKVVSIGPLHHGEGKLKPMEAHKKRYLNAILDQNQDIMLDDYVRMMRGLEEKVRKNYYEDQFIHTFSSDEFVTMMLLDGCFIVELFLLRVNPGARNKYDPMFRTDSIYASVHRDMMLLENQLPFFLLEDLFNFINGSDKRYTPFSFFELTVDYFNIYLKMDQAAHLSNSGYQIKHFIDLFLRCYLPSETTNLEMPPKEERKTIYLPSATELEEAGLRIKKGIGNSFLDISYRDGELEIPTLSIVDSTEDRFRNLIAMEQCHTGSTAYISDYIILLDFLVNTPKDVTLLRSCGVFVNFLGSDEEVCRLLNKLGSNVVRDTTESHYYTVLQNMNDYCNTPWHVWRAKLRREYFSNPWAVISLNAAIILLICTVIQAVCSLIPLAK